MFRSIATTMNNFFASPKLMIYDYNKKNMSILDIHEDNFYDINKFLCPATRYKFGLTCKTIRQIIARFMKMRSEHIYMFYYGSALAHAYIENGEWVGFMYCNDRPMRQQFLACVEYDNGEDDIVHDKYVFGDIYMGNIEDIFTRRDSIKVCPIPATKNNVRMSPRLYLDRKNKILMTIDTGVYYYFTDVTYLRSDGEVLEFVLKGISYKFEYRHVIIPLNTLYDECYEDHVIDDVTGGLCYLKGDDPRTFYQGKNLKFIFDNRKPYKINEASSQ